MIVSPGDRLPPSTSKHQAIGSLHSAHASISQGDLRVRFQCPRESESIGASERRGKDYLS
jgi:hypothetical protein